MGPTLFEPAEPQEDAVAFRWGSAAQAPVSPEKLLVPRRYGDGQKDLWSTLNCIQENAVQGGQRDAFRRRPNGQRMPKSRALTGIDEGLRLNQALWERAETLRAQTP